MDIKFDQGDIKQLNLKEISEWNRKIRDMNHTLVLRGFIQCNECGGTTPLDMFIDEGWKVCKCKEEVI